MTIRRGNSIIAGNAVDIPSQTGQSGKFLTTNGTTTSWAAVNVDTSDIYNKIDTKQEKSTAVNYNNISNCITYIPQDIKLELNNGTLTLKAGSKVYVPNGAGVFDVRTTNEDLSVTGSEIDYATKIITLTSNFGLKKDFIEDLFSGATAPTSVRRPLWYDTTNNIIKTSNDYGKTWSGIYSFPICIYTITRGVITSIDQVFNGFGYIGSTVFALPGVKGLIPNGRNADGSLKNIDSITTKVNLLTFSTDTDGTTEIVTANDWIGESIGHYSYNSESNFVLFDSDKITGYMINSCKLSHGRITSFTPKTVFHALDYNDKSTISGWSMPSNRYIDLTLGASGSTYTAPANGWFNFDKRSSATGQYVIISNETGGYVWEGAFTSYGNSVECFKSVPVKKRDTIKIVYTLGGATLRFAFIFAEGEPYNPIGRSSSGESGSNEVIDPSEGGF